VGLKTKWTQTFLEVDSSHSYLLKDLQQLHKHFLGLKQRCSRFEDTLSQQSSQTLAQFDRLALKLDQNLALNEVTCTDVGSFH